MILIGYEIWVAMTRENSILLSYCYATLTAHLFNCIKYNTCAFEMQRYMILYLMQQKRRTKSGYEIVIIMCNIFENLILR